MNKFNIIIFTFFSLLTIISVTGLVTSIIFGVVNENKHYHSEICHVNDCVSRNSICCNGLRCRECFSVDVNYDLHIFNKTYNKIESGKVNEFNCNIKNLQCFYDDRSMYDSLTVFKKYRPIGGIFGVILSVALVFVAITGLVITYSCTYRNKQTDTSHNDINLSNNKPKNQHNVELEIQPSVESSVEASVELSVESNNSFEELDIIDLSPYRSNISLNETIVDN